MTPNPCRLKATFIRRLVCAATLLTFLFSQSTLQAQEVIATGGNHHKAGDISVSWTLGETVIETFKADENILTQGFHQSKLTVVSIDEIDMPGYNITVFPNPAKGCLTLSVEADKYENMNFMLYDFNGNLIKQGFIHEKNTRISFEGLKPAVYFIRITEQNKHLTTIKVIKN